MSSTQSILGANKICFFPSSVAVTAFRGVHPQWRMMIDLSHMHSVDVNPEAMSMRADGGSSLGHLDVASTAHNLMTTTGIVSHTGTGGFTLGGGVGRTDRKMGLAIDNLLEVTVVIPQRGSRSRQ